MMLSLYGLKFTFARGIFEQIRAPIFINRGLMVELMYGTKESQCHQWMVFMDGNRGVHLFHLLVPLSNVNFNYREISISSMASSLAHNKGSGHGRGRSSNPRIFW